MRSSWALAVALWACAVRAQTLPQGFTDTLVARVPLPTAMAFLPDGRILVTSQTGVVRLIQNDQVLPDPVLTIPATSICSNSERGLLGVAVDPEFNRTGFVYLFYTYRGPGRDCSGGTPRTPMNRVSRFVMDAASGRIDAGTETVLIDNVASYNGNHNAGDLKFDRSGNLFVTTGDGGCDYKGTGRCGGANDAARERHTLLGKVLRIDRDGNIPSGGNPWSQQPGVVRCNRGNAQPGQMCEETWAWGFRNPFRIAIAPEIGMVIANDVGQNTWEEIDDVQPGTDYGWNAREGFCATGSTTDCVSTADQMFGNFRNPIYAYQQGVQVPGTQISGCNSLSGGAYVPENTWNTLPVSFGGYYFADYVCGSIFRIPVSIAPGIRPAPTANEFARGFGQNSLISLELAPYGNTKALYYSTYARGGEVHRIVGFTAASAASYVRSVLTPDSLASLFGVALSGASIVVRDSAGVERSAEVLYSSETQLNFLVPAGTALGTATLLVRNGGGTVVTTTAEIRAFWPGIFTANGDGAGVPAATAVRLTAFAQQTVPVFDCPRGAGSCVPVPIDVTEGDVYLSLYGTGIRGQNPVRVTTGGTPLEVLYAGPQPQYPGLDQINVRLRAALAGLGEILLVVGGADPGVGQVMTINIR